MTSGAFVLAHFMQPDKLLPVAEHLTRLQPPVTWEAVDGHVHLVARSTDSSSAIAQTLQQHGGQVEVSTFAIEAFVAIRNGGDQPARVYAFLEIDPTKRAAVRDLVAGLPSVAQIWTVTGGCDLVALLTGEGFSKLEQIIAEQIRPMDGVLRLKHACVIGLTSL